MADLIDRSKLKLATFRDDDGEMACYVQEIMEAPTVDAVEVVHGRWIEGFFKDTYECSVCFENGVAKCYESKSNYCPNCGADMRDGDGNGN